MAKKAAPRKRRKSSVRKRVRTSSRQRATTPARVSTRRQPSSRAKAPRARGAASRASRAPASETLQVTFELRDVSDRLIRDPETFFTFRRVADRRQISDQLALELTGTASVFALPAS